jgi:predicted glutamine amidotransferase
MCGLVGFAGNNSAAIQKAFRFMLLVDQIRGSHSTGIATVNKSNDVKLFKRAIHSTDFLDMKQTDKIIDSLGYNAIIGHNRAATKGLINTVNSHPFDIGDIVLAHNGTLRNQGLLPDSKDFQVDSENICYSINKIGLEATLKLLAGAFALTFYDKSNKTVNLIRNDERDLYYCFVENSAVNSTDKNAIMWASEAWMLRVAAGKSGLTITNPVLLPVGKLLTLSYDTHYFGDIEKKVKFKDMELYVPPVKKHQNTVVSFVKPYRFCVQKYEVLSTGGYKYIGETEGGTNAVVIFTPHKMFANLLYEGKALRSYYDKNELTIVIDDAKEVKKPVKKNSTGMAVVSH